MAAIASDTSRSISSSAEGLASGGSDRGGPGATDSLSGGVVSFDSASVGPFASGRSVILSLFGRLRPVYGVSQRSVYRSCNPTAIPFDNLCHANAENRHFTASFLTLQQGFVKRRIVLYPRAAN
jgi:hypothetical protein